MVITRQRISTQSQQHFTQELGTFGGTWLVSTAGTMDSIKFPGRYFTLLKGSSCRPPSSGRLHRQTLSGPQLGKASDV